MATSSIIKNFVIETAEQAEKFLSALEKSINDKQKDISVNVRYYEDMSDEEKKDFLNKISIKSNRSV